MSYLRPLEMSTKRHNLLLVALVGLGLVGYTLPWLHLAPASLSMGAYDLAEWSSLVPAVRQSAPFLWTALLLRLPLAALGLLLAGIVTLFPHNRRIDVIVLALTCLALLPPIEFLTQYHEDVNYRQQFAVAVTLLIVGCIIIALRHKPFHSHRLIAITILGILCAVLGLYESITLMRGFQLSVQIASGGILYILALSGLAIVLKQNRVVRPTLF